MERGIYFDGWQHDNHCYHPSLPFRSMQMVEDLERYRATILVWSVMGGGSISLPYLENEAFGELDPRLRFYGFMNDAEFIAECNKRGIKTMGIVFEVQGWEFPVVVSADGRFVRQMNVLREKDGAGKGTETADAHGTKTSDAKEAKDGEIHGWYGLNEFASGKFDGLFRTSLKDYYPEGIVNSDGELVTNLQEEVAARTFRGEPVHAAWVEVQGHSKTCYQTCRNNPVWREYLKKIIRLQIDAGVAGIQLDEAELPITSMGAGGCFCKDCRKQFREYLIRGKKAGTLSPAFDGVDVETFDYQQYLLDHGCQHPTDAPFYRDFYEFQMRAVKKYFTELVDFARDYARRTQHREIWMSGNFFNCMPVYYPFENTVDVVITEMDKTLFRQPHWYRYVNGFSGEKPVIVAENPYGGVVPQLVEQLTKGRAYDLYRLFLLEASVYGCNMSVPYGGWMGNTIKTGFWPPRDVTEEVQTFLADFEGDFSKKSGAKVLVPYSFPSYYWREVTKKGSMDQFTNVDKILFYKSVDEESDAVTRLPFWEVIQKLSEKQVLYDVKMFGDEELRPETVSAEDWKGYELIVLPECAFLTANQREELERFVRGGGRLLMQGRTAENAPGWAGRMAKLAGVTAVENPAGRREALAVFEAAFDAAYASVGQLRIRTKEAGAEAFIGAQTHVTANGSCLHLLNYRYDAEADRVEPIEGVRVQLRVDRIPRSVQVRGLDGKLLPAAVSAEDGVLHVALESLPLYAVIEML